MFVAVPVPDEVRDHLDEFLAPRRDAAEVRWVLADQVHVTLAFLAGVPDRAVDDLEERLERAAAKRTAFATRITGGGVFPGVADARVLWAGLDLDAAGAVELDRLATGARAAAARSGIDVDGGRFRPHVTLGRFRVPLDATRWLRLLSSYDGPAWQVDRIELVESFLGQGPGGRPRHETRAAFRLADPTGTAGHL